MADPISTRSILRIRSEQGWTRGTGFFISAQGHVLTCYHVVDGMGPIEVLGEGIRAASQLDEDLSVPELDLAVLRTGVDPPEVVPVELEWRVGASFWSWGFHQRSASIVGGFPTLGRIGGSAEVSYSSGARTFQLVALRIEDSLIGPGLSGAPAVLPEDGVAIGVVGTQYKEDGGFVLPFASAALQGSKLAALLEENRRTIPRYGSFLNLAGFQSACRDQAKRALALLEAQFQFLPRLYIERRSAGEILDDFLSGSYRILPVIGPSGVGKTQLLAALAARWKEERTVVLLSGYRMSERQGSLAESIAAELVEAQPILAGTRELTRRIGEILAGSPSPLLILLDGLNEMQAPAPAVRLWLERSNEWLRSASARLVVSSRPEFWQDVRSFLDPALLYKKQHREGVEDNVAEGLSVGDFSDEEREDALRAYAIPEEHRDDPIFHHPLLVRLYSEAAKIPRKGGGRINAYTLFSQFLEEKRKKVLLRVTPKVSIPRFRERLEALGRELAKREDLWLPSSQFFAQFAAEPELADALLEEHLLLAGAEGFRFSLDELAYFLVAEAVELPEDGGLELEDLSINVRNAAPYLVARLEAAGRPEAARRLLERTTELAEAYPFFLYELLIARIFRHLAEPGRYFDFFEKIAHSYGGPTRRAEPGEHLVAALTGGLGLQQRLALLQILVRTEHYYPWEPKHWRDLSHEGFEAENLRWNPVPNAIWRELNANPEVTIDVLLAWLEDETGLTSGERETFTSRVRDVAAALLFHICPERFAGIADRLAQGIRTAERWGPSYLLQMMIARWPEEALASFERWTARKDPELDAIVCDYAGFLLQTKRSEITERLGQLIGEILARTASRDLMVKLQARLAQIPSRRSEVEESLIRSLHAGDTFLTPWELSAYLHTDFDGILQELDRFIREKSESEGAADAVGVLSTVLPDPHKGPRVLELFESYIDGKPHLHYAMARGAEDTIYKVERGSSLEARLLDFARRLYQVADDTARTPLIYLATHLHREDPAAGGALLEQLIQWETDPGNLGLLVALFAKERTFRDALPWIQKIVTKRGIWKDPWAAVLFNGLTHAPFLTALAEWAQVQKERELSPVLREFKRQAAAGLSLSDAAFAALSPDRGSDHSTST